MSSVCTIPATARDGSRFWSCVAVIDDATSCWEWKRGCGSHGYGQFYEQRGKPLLAHRHAWVLTNGAIHDGSFVLHRCDNKRCVRPDHLFLGTQGDNIRDCVMKGRHRPYVARGDACASTKVSDAQAEKIKCRLVRGTRQNPGNALQLSKEFGISRARVYQIGRGARA